MDNQRDEFDTEFEDDGSPQICPTDVLTIGISDEDIIDHTEQMHKADLLLQLSKPVDHHQQPQQQIVRLSAQMAAPPPPPPITTVTIPTAATPSYQAIPTLVSVTSNQFHNHHGSYQTPIPTLEKFTPLPAHAESTAFATFNHTVIDAKHFQTQAIQRRYRTKLLLRPRSALVRIHILTPSMETPSYTQDKIFKYPHMGVQKPGFLSHIAEESFRYTMEMPLFKDLAEQGLLAMCPFQDIAYYIYDPVTKTNVLNKYAANMLAREWELQPPPKATYDEEGNYMCTFVIVQYLKFINTTAPSQPSPKKQTPTATTATQLEDEDFLNPIIDQIRGKTSFLSIPTTGNTTLTAKRKRDPLELNINNKRVHLSYATPQFPLTATYTLSNVPVSHPSSQSATSNDTADTLNMEIQHIPLPTRPLPHHQVPSTSLRLQERLGYRLGPPITHQFQPR